MTLAKAVVSGIVTKAPEKRFTNNDMAIAGFTINIDKQNETLLRVVTFGQLADNVANTVMVGDSVVVEGKLQINSFKTPNGKEKRVYEIMAGAVEKMSGNCSTPQISTAPDENIVLFNEDEVAQDLIDEDEIPF